MSRIPGGAPWRIALAITACLAFTAIGTAPAHAADLGDDHLPPNPQPTSSEQQATGTDDPSAPRGRTLGISAADVAAGSGQESVARLAAGTGSISGTVTELTDFGPITRPLVGANVTALSYNAATSEYDVVGYADSTANGQYTISGLAAGQYLVHFSVGQGGGNPLDNERALLPEFWEDAAYAEWASEVTVTDGADTANVDEMLEPMLSSYIAGASRYETSAAIASYFEADVDCVYVASGMNFPDALSAAPAAAACGGPLLLVTTTSVPGAIASQLARLNPANVFIAGGTGAVSADVETAIGQLVPEATVQRISGANRYATSRAIVDAAFGATKYVWLATGVNFPDALAASNAAAAFREPVLIVPGNEASLDAATLSTIADRNPEALIIAGGTGVVSSGIETQMLGAYPGTFRLAGGDRYATSIAINEWNWDIGNGGTSAYAFLTNGMNFPDALSGAALAGGSLGAPMFTVPPTCVPDAVRYDIARLWVHQSYLLGYFSEISFDEPLKHC